MFYSFIHAEPLLPKNKQRCALTSKQYHLLAKLLPLSLFPEKGIGTQKKALKYLHTLPPTQIHNQELQARIREGKITISNIRTVLSKRSVHEPAGKLEIHSSIQNNFALDMHLLQISDHSKLTHHQFMQDLFEQHKYTVVKEKKKKEVAQLARIPKHAVEDILKLEERMAHCKGMFKIRNRHTAPVSALNEHLQLKMNQYEKQLQQIRTDIQQTLFLEQRQSSEQDAYIKWKLSQSKIQPNCLERFEQRQFEKVRMARVTKDKVAKIVSLIDDSPTNTNLWGVELRIEQLTKQAQALQKAGKLEEAEVDIQLVHNIRKFHALLTQQMSIQEELNNMEKDLKWASIIYKDRNILKQVFKILRKGFDLQKWQTEENYKEDYQRATTQQEQYNLDLNNLILAVDWQLLYNYDGAWTLHTDDSEYLQYFQTRWRVRKSKETQLQKEFEILQGSLQDNTVQDNQANLTASFQIFQQLRILQQKK